VYVILRFFSSISLGKICSKKSLNKAASTHYDNEFTVFFQCKPFQRTIRWAFENLAATAKGAAMARANELSGR
jgi:hypothetical protein